MKRQSITVSPGSRLLAVASLIVRAVEEYNEDYDPQGFRVATGWEDAAVGGGEEVVVAVEPTMGYEVGEIEEEVAGGILVRVVRGEASGYSLAELFSRAPRLAWALEKGEIRRVARETTETGLEFMFIYLTDGRRVFLEGEEYRVSLPGLGNIVSAMIHTHPRGSCGLSQADVRSGLDLLTSGGLFEAAATEDCMYYMARIGLVGEDDYVELWGSRGEDIPPRRFKTIELGVVY